MTWSQQQALGQQQSKQQNQINSGLLGAYMQGLGQQQQLKPKKEITMLKEIKNDMRSFLTEHKSIIYSLFLFYVLDKFIFDGKFTQRLHTMANNMVSNIEHKINKGTEIPNDKK